MVMSVNKAREFAKEQRAVSVAQLRALGFTQTAIARQLKLSQPTVSRILAKETARLRAATSAHLETHRAWQLARLDTISTLAAQEWSATPSGTRHARLLGVMIEASVRQQELLGLTLPQMPTVSVVNETHASFDLSKLSDAQLDTLQGLVAVADGTASGELLPAPEEKPVGLLVVGPQVPTSGTSTSTRIGFRRDPDPDIVHAAPMVPMAVTVPEPAPEPASESAPVCVPGAGPNPLAWLFSR